MKILGIETSTRRAALAIARGGALLAEAVLPDEARPSAELVPALERLLASCGMSAGDIGGIAVGTGPGSFTGIRLGIATARGLSLARGTAIRGIGGFDNILAGFSGALPADAPSSSIPARGGGPPSRICPIVDAHSYGVYAAIYERAGAGLRCAVPAFVSLLPELPGRIAGDVFFVGPQLGKFRDALAGLFGPRASFDAEDRFPTASAAALLYESPAALRDDPPGTVAPLYILPGVRVKAVVRKP